jgi:hypothetical protein
MSALERALEQLQRQIDGLSRDLSRLQTQDTGAASGGTGAGTVRVYHDDLTGQVNGAGSGSFTTSFNYVSGTLNVYVNGFLQRKGVDFSEATASTFVMASNPLDGSTVIAMYDR